MILFPNFKVLQTFFIVFLSPPPLIIMHSLCSYYSHRTLSFSSPLSSLNSNLNHEFYGNTSPSSQQQTFRPWKTCSQRRKLRRGGDLPYWTSQANRDQHRRPDPASMDLPDVVFGPVIMRLPLFPQPVLLLQDRASYHNPNHSPSCHTSHWPLHSFCFAQDPVRDSRFWVKKIFFEPWCI